MDPLEQQRQIEQRATKNRIGTIIWDNPCSLAVPQKNVPM